MSQHHRLGVCIPESLKQKEQEFKASPGVWLRPCLRKTRELGVVVQACNPRQRYLSF